MSHAPKNKLWQPSAAIQTLHMRADILTNIRAFFSARHVMEVDTPLMCRTSVTDPFIDSIPALYQAHPNSDSERFYLQTSPEYAMKRLLAAGSGSIYQICKAFRQAETGRMHNPEFTMLEWYRTGYDQQQLMNEVDELLQVILHTAPGHRMTYQQLFLTSLAIDPLAASLDELQTCALDHNINIDADITDRDTWLNLLMTHCIEPQLGMDRPHFIFDFPVSQAALARVNPDHQTAARFEVYYQGLELANGFHELQHADEQRRRFEKNNAARMAAQLAPMPIDELFLSALQAGLPDCSGVALGVDRLVMLALGKTTIHDVMSFDVSRV